MNQTIQSQLNHRSIRKFKDQTVEPEIFSHLLEVANRTASSMAAQSFSIIHVTDTELKLAISEVCKQPYVAKMPELLIFIVDAYRNHQIVCEQGEDFAGSYDVDRFFQGYTDGCLAAQNVTTAIESLGLGCVYLGSILNNVEKMISLLDLPKYTFPIVGLGFGYADEEPALKPRMDIGLKIFENKYKKLDNYLDAVKEYDEVMKTYYDLRDTSKALPAFSLQMKNRAQNPNPVRNTLLQVIQKQGFDLNVNSTETK